MLVSVNDLKIFMDIELSLRQQDAAEFVLEGLEAEIEAYLGRPITAQSFTETHSIPANNVGVPTTSFFYESSPTWHDQPMSSVSQLTYIEPPHTVYLRNSPVQSVESVTLTPISGDAQTLAQDVDFIVRRYGIDIFKLYANDKVEVTYTAGVDDPKATNLFKILILRAATREMQNMHDDVVGVKDLEPRGVAPLETGFNERELMTLKRYRRTRIG